MLTIAHFFYMFHVPPYECRLADTLISPKKNWILHDIFYISQYLYPYEHL